MKTTIYTAVLMFIAFCLNAQTGSINNVTIKPADAGNGKFDIQYDLAGSSGSYNISVEVLFNGETEYIPVNKLYLKGDIAAVAPGVGKKIEWNGLGSFPDRYSEKTRIKIVATGVSEAKVPTEGLIAYYPFSNGSASDASGNNNNGTNNGALPTTDRFGVNGMAMEFNGSNNFIQANIPNSFTDISYSLWVYSTSATTNTDRGVVILNNQTGMGWGYGEDFYYYAPNDKALILSSCNDPRNINCAYKVPKNQWIHLVVCYSNSGIKFYGNGNLIYSNTANITRNKGTLYIGRGNFPAVTYMKGKIDDVRIYNRVLTDNEVASLYSETSSQTVYESSSFTDSRDGKTYKTVKIGNQWWMAENLAYLPFVNTPSQVSFTTPHYYVYNYNGTNVEEAKTKDNYKNYGVLYNYEAAKAACPPGWHLPSDAEWKQLEMTLGMTQAQTDASGKRGTDQGFQMKSVTGWIQNGNGNNSSLFEGKPSGYTRHDGSGFWKIGEIETWWTTTNSATNSKLCRYLFYNYSNVDRSPAYFSTGLSVRCVKDTESSGPIPTNGLVAHYPFNGNANDESGNGFNLTNNGNPTLISDRNGKINSAYTFNGTTDFFYHSRSNALNPTDEFTLNLWFKNPGIDSDQDVLISTFDTPDIGGYQIALDNAKATSYKTIHFSFYGSNWSYVAEIYDSKYLSKWNMVTAIYTSTQLKLYMNGNLVQSKTHSGQINYNGTNNFRIGANPHALNNRRLFLGSIDDIRIYNRALTEQEIQSLYKE